MPGYSWYFRYHRHLYYRYHYIHYNILKNVYKKASNIFFLLKRLFRLVFVLNFKLLVFHVLESNEILRHPNGAHRKFELLFTIQQQNQIMTKFNNNRLKLSKSKSN